MNINELKSQKKIYLVDVSSLFFRAFYAIRPLSSTQGVPVNAVYGFLTMIIKLIKEKNPEYMLFCYDRKEPSFRKEVYADYKANRTEMPEDLQKQMPYLKQVAGLLGIADLEVPLYEADDIIGTVALMAAKQNYQVYIVSGDKDFCQLVNENIFIYDTMKEFIYTIDAVKEKHGVFPYQFIDFLAITGDTSDHIPGVAGVGPKGAQKLIEQFGTLEKIYDQIEDVKPAGLQEKLKKSKDNALLSKKLVTIVTDIPMSQTIEEFKIKKFQLENLRAFLQDLNFKSLEKSLLGDGQVAFEYSESANKVLSEEKNVKVDTYNQSLNSKDLQNTNLLKTQELGSIECKEIFLNFDELQSKIQQEPFFCFSTNDELCFVFNNHEIMKFEINPNSLLFNNEFQKLNFKNVIWSGFDLKKIWHILNLSEEQINSVRVDADFMLQAYCLKSQDANDPIDLIKDFLNKDIKPAAKEKLNFLILGESLAQLKNFLTVELDSKNLTVIYEKIERPLIPILYLMEKKGIELDIQSLKIFSEELQIEIQDIENKIYEVAKEKFNIASPKQLGIILFEKLGLEATKKTKTGYSTDNDVLEKMIHPIAPLVIEFRELSKLKSTYVDALPLAVDAHSRLHTHFNQALTSTGRLSSTQPNLQNIPIKTEKGQKVRKAFVASSKIESIHDKDIAKSVSPMSLLSLDYSQIELRILAHISEDPGLVNAFKNDLDIHQATASEVFGVDLHEVTKDQRRIAKAVNFGIAYGQGAFGLAETLGISRTESKQIIDKYFIKFAGIKDYIDSTIEKAHANKYVETLFGRRRYLPELDSSHQMVKKFGERAAINAPIQGTASDLVKLAMIDIHRLFQSQHVEAYEQKKLMRPPADFKLLLQVHDELIFEGPLDFLKEISHEIKFQMENVVKLRVPLKVNFAFGQNWDDAH